ncbi:hypothetical protein FKM82_015211 [Ascaphus truei]
MERRRSDGVHTVEPTEPGDYMICFDNSFSSISEKLVFFELIFDSQQGDEDPDSWAEMVEPDELLDIKVEDIKQSFTKSHPLPLLKHRTLAHPFFEPCPL